MAGQDMAFLNPCGYGRWNPQCNIRYFRRTALFFTCKSNGFDSFGFCFHKGFNHIFAVTGSRNADEYIPFPAKTFDLPLKTTS